MRISKSRKQSGQFVTPVLTSFLSASSEEAGFVRKHAATLILMGRHCANTSTTKCMLSLIFYVFTYTYYVLSNRGCDYNAVADVRAFLH